MLTGEEKFQGGGGGGREQGNFQRGRRVKLKEASEGGVGAFSGSTYSIVFNGLLCTSNEAKSHIL